MRKQYNIFKHVLVVIMTLVLIAGVSGCNENNPEINTYKVIFNYHNGSTDLIIDINEGQVVEEPNQPLKTGHDFVDWFYGDTPYDFNQPVVSDLVLSASWSVKSYPFKVLDFKGNPLIDENLPYGTYFKPLIPNAPFMFGFEFVGYNTDANTMIDEAITIQPIYTAVTDFVHNYTFNSTIRKVQTNDFSNAVLLENGQLYMWGHNGSPYLLCGGFDYSYDTLTPTEISGQFDLQANEIITDIYLGVDGNYAITSHGRFFTWGQCFDCNLGLCEDDVAGYPTDITEYFRIGQESIKQYFIVQNYILVVTHSGKIYNSGTYIDKNNLTLSDNKQWIDQTNHFNLGSTEEVLKAIKKYNSGGLLTTEGRLFMWGQNTSGALGLEEDIVKTDIPVDITNRFDLNPDEKIIDFNFGYLHTLVLTNQGRVFGFGMNVLGQLGDSEDLLPIYGPQDITSKLDLNPSEHVVQIASNFTSVSIFLTNQGRAIALGNNRFNQLSLSDIEYFNEPLDITNAFGHDQDTFKQWAIGSKFIIYVSTNGIAISGNRIFEFYFE